MTARISVSGLIRTSQLMLRLRGHVMESVYIHMLVKLACLCGDASAPATHRPAQVVALFVPDGLGVPPWRAAGAHSEP